jgi:predicted tellurium resistance membrane protein TerC
MAFLKKLIDKPTYIMIAGVWTAISTFATSYFALNPLVQTVIVTVGNLIIAWVGVETHPDSETA